MIFLQYDTGCCKLCLFWLNIMNNLAQYIPPNISQYFIFWWRYKKLLTHQKNTDEYFYG